MREDLIKQHKEESRHSPRRTWYSVLAGSEEEGARVSGLPALKSLLERVYLLILPPISGTMAWLC
ncbi:hypothetical protein J6590_018666 [Homalodisca vitripennis]|nr:hypothetical protein J6590_018666 [Homalodisca vitripennis]